MNKNDFLLLMSKQYSFIYKNTKINIGKGLIVMKFYGETIEEIISTIFEEALSVKYSKKPRNCNQELFGFYVDLPQKGNEEIKQLEPLHRLFYSCKSLGRKRVMGLNQQCDSENTFAQTLEFIFVSFNDYFRGELNDKLSEELQIHNIEDIHRVLNNEELLDKVCGYIYGCVNNRFREYIKHGNVDFLVNGNDFKPIKFVYLDKKEDGFDLDKHNIIGEEEFVEHTGELTKHLLTYMSSMTKAQQQWCQAVIDFGIQSNGSVINLDTGEVLYSKQSCNQYKNQIRKRILKLIKEDKHIDTVGERWIYKG